jgi:hypothetical protein
MIPKQRKSKAKQFRKGKAILCVGVLLFAMFLTVFFLLC